jgi:hypothetical protein
MSEEKLVPTVAFAYLSPVALRVFLKFGGGYRVHVFTGDELDLSLGKPSSNIVVLPNFANRHKLAPYADQIGRLIVLSNNQHNKLAEAGVPILDAVIDDDGNVHRAKPRTPHYYTKLINDAAVGLEIGKSEDEPTKKPAAKEKSKVKPKTLDNWLDLLDKAVSEDTDTATELEDPICLYLVGELGKGDFQNALKALTTTEDADKKSVRVFYKWATTSDYARNLSKAARVYLWPDTDEAPSISEVAKKFGVEILDLDLLEGIYSAQGENG